MKQQELLLTGYLEQPLHLCRVTNPRFLYSSIVLRFATTLLEYLLRAFLATKIVFVHMRL